MKKTLMFCVLAALAFGAQAAEPKIAKAVDLSKVGKAIRDGKMNVGKKYVLPEGGRFHNIHDVTIGLGCNGCHALGGYEDNALFLRKAEFPLKTSDGEDVGYVNRAKCLACHSEGGAGRPFYNITKK
jgi:cytochrome c